MTALKPATDARGSAALVVLPTFNNETTLANVIAGVALHQTDILVVDDGSTDATPRILGRTAGIRVIRHSENRGKGAAMMTAFRYAQRLGYETVIIIDADGQHRPQDLPRILNKLASHPGHIIIGARDMNSPESGDVPTISRFGRWISNFWVWVESGVHLKDTQSGLRAYPLSRLPLAGLNCRRYDFEIEILVRSLWAGIPVATEDISVFYPLRSERVSHFDPWKDNARLTVLHTKLVTMRIIAKIFRLNLGEILGRRGERLAARAEGRSEIAHPAGDEAPRAENPGARALAFCLQFFGIAICYFFAPIVVLAFYLSGTRARLAVHDFYARLEPADPAPQFLRSFKNFVYFGASLIDRLALAKGKFRPLNSIKIDQRPIRPEGPAIMIGAHFGDWTFCGSALADRKGQKLAVLMDLRITPKFQALVREQSKGRFEFIDASGSGLEVVLKVKAFLDEKGLVCFLADRAQKNGTSINSPFLGEQASFPLAPFQLAAHLNVPVHSFFCLKRAYRPHAPYVVYLDQIWDGREKLGGEALAKRFMARLEHHVRRAPHHWFNFFPFWGNQRHAERERIAAEDRHARTAQP